MGQSLFLVLTPLIHTRERQVLNLSSSLDVWTLILCLGLNLHASPTGSNFERLFPSFWGCSEGCAVLRLVEQAAGYTGYTGFWF